MRPVAPTVARATRPVIRRRWTPAARTTAPPATERDHARRQARARSPGRRLRAGAGGGPGGRIRHPDAVLGPPHGDGRNGDWLGRGSLGAVPQPGGAGARGAAVIDRGLLAPPGQG